MADQLNETARVANDFTARWIERTPADQSFVFSGPGLHGLLAALAAGADGAARHELEAATGLDAGSAAAWSAELAARLSEIEGVSSAAGMWLRDGLQVLEPFSDALQWLECAALPAGHSKLNDWVQDRTDGEVEAFPASPSDETLLLLASVVVARGDWETRWSFGESTISWRGEDRPGLFRPVTSLDAVSVCSSMSGRVARVVVPAKNGLTVHLLSGDPDAGSAAVLRGGLEAISGAATTTAGDALIEGDQIGGLEVARAVAHGPEFRLRLPVFGVTTEWDLVEHPEVFGLRSATDASRGHFPAVSDFPLAVEAAVQATKFAFSAHGFRAASTSMVMMLAGGAPPTDTHLCVSVTLDEPFGFLVVAPGGPVLFAGWVEDPGEVEQLDGFATV